MKSYTYRLPLNLQLFAEGDGDIGAAASSETGVEGASAAGEQSQGSEGAAAATGVEGEGAADPGKQNNFEKAFAKRLSAEREKWNADHKAELEKFKDHDAFKRAAEYLQKTTGIADIMTLKEEIELAELQERAEKEKVPAAVLKRIDELEAKAAKGDELEAAQKQQEEWQSFETSLKDFCKDKTIDGKPVEHMDLWKYMHENEVSKPEVAYKAMKADALEAKLDTARTDAVNEYLESKKAPKIEGSQGAAAHQAPGRAGSIEAAEQRALSRMRAAREAQ